MSSCIELKNVFRNFGSIRVLHDVNIKVKKSEVRAMVGEHGAGKTTIAKIMAGLIPPSSGDILLFDKKLQHRVTTFPSVEIVHQTVQLMENLTVSENMFAGDNNRLPFFLHRKKKLHKITNQFFSKMGISLRGEYLVGELKRADLVLIDILRKLYKNPQLLILDEAIEQLSNESAQIVIDILKREKKRGMSVIYITHRIDDVYTFADTVSIVKSGSIGYTEVVEDIDKINLIKIAYTQLSENNNLDQYNEDFFHLLKYNEAILRKLPVSLIVVGRDEIVKIINEAAQNLLNIDSSYVNTHLEIVFEKSKDIINLIKKSFQNEEMQQFYYLPFKRTDKKDILINISKVPIFDEHFLIGNILLLHDITEQEILREEFELREKLAATGLLAAGVAHEINNPLGMILNDLHFLKVVSTDKRIQHRVINLEKHFGFITDVISNLLTFSGENQSSPEPVDVNLTIQELLHLLEYYVKSKNVTLSFHSTESDLTIEVVANELKQILLNLIKNSIEAFEDGGKIDIYTSMQSIDNTVYAKIIVSDNGPGISNEKVKDIFLPFKSAKDSKDGNLGLGLSVSYNIIQKYNGKIHVDTEQGKGCTLTLLFPAVTTKVS